MSKIHAAITAVNGYVPDYVLTNEELATMVDTNDEWIVSRTGIKERRIQKGEGLATSDLAVPAVEGLLKKRGIGADEIDLIIFCTTSPDMPFPATANILAHKVGAVNAWGFDLQAACSGFLFGLATGAQFIENGKHTKVLVIGADKMSSMVDYTDRATCIIFGDGSGVPYLHQKAGGSLKPASHESIDAREHYAYQEGQAVFKFAVTSMADVAAEVMERNDLKSEDIAWLVPHQANKRIIDATANRTGVSADRVIINIERYGNTTNGTIPLCLWEWEDKFKKGDILIFAAFGGGFTWGSIYLKWAY